MKVHTLEEWFIFTSSHCLPQRAGPYRSDFPAVLYFGRGRVSARGSTKARRDRADKEVVCHLQGICRLRGKQSRRERETSVFKGSVGQFLEML
jgi:hypothetical protein